MTYLRGDRIKLKHSSVDLYDQVIKYTYNIIISTFIIRLNYRKYCSTLLHAQKLKFHLLAIKYSPAPTESQYTHHYNER
ncbi:hypothetical protein QTP88_013210 [Uroleucon formosanum]